MALNLSIPQETELKPRIVVFGVGGAGGNAVNNMINAKLQGVDFVVSNTDAQALARSLSDRRIQMGAAITQGLGAGMRPEFGAQAAEDSLSEILEHLEDAHMLFVTAGMGGGTGTGAAPIIARAAKEQGILTVGVVTKPFHFEGRKRMRLAEEGIEALQSVVDTLIVIPNQNLFRVATEKTTISEAFSMADGVLHAGVRSITDLMVMPGLINLDFADVRTVMDEMGKAMMGAGEAEGEKRAIEAAHAAISNPLLDDVSMKGAKGVLINISGGADMTLYEVDEAANEVRNEADPDANIIVGSAFDETLSGKIRVSVVATGIDSEMDSMMESASNLSRQGQEKSSYMASPPLETQFNKQKSQHYSQQRNMEENRRNRIGEKKEIDPVEPPILANQVKPGQENNVSPAMQIQAIEPENTEEAKISSSLKSGFSGLFSKRRKPPTPQPNIKTSSTKINDLFDEDAEDDLEIPAFLRRQAN